MGIIDRYGRIEESIGRGKARFGEFMGVIALAGTGADGYEISQYREHLMSGNDKIAAAAGAIAVIVGAPAAFMAIRGSGRSEVQGQAAQEIGGNGIL